MKKTQLIFCTKRQNIKFILLLCFLMFSITRIGAQNTGYDVSGMVTNNKGEPVIGASIIEKGTTNGAITSINGSYSMKISGRDAVLMFTSLGMIPQELRVSGRNTIDVILQEDNFLLDELVVIGYGQMKRSDLTGSISSLKADVIENKTIASVDNALRGLIAGVSVRQNNGQPGGGASIRIRGTTSINGTNEPLYVIDGVPLLRENIADGQGLVINPLSSINVNDIESIEVLKDASASAIYGARGANGVILITTKKGKVEGKNEVVYNYTFSQQRIDKVYKLLDGPQLAQLLKEAYENANMSVPAYCQDPASVVTRTNWLDEIFRTASTQNHQIRFTGSSKNTTYNLSGGYFNQEGILINTSLNRYTFRGQINSDIKSFISVGSNIAYSQVETKGYDNAARNLSLISMAMDMNPAVPIYDENGNYTFRNNLSSSTGVYGGNPVATAYETDMRNNNNRFTGDMFMDVKFFNNKLIFKTLFGVDDIFSSDRLFFPKDLAISSDGPGKGRATSYTTKSWSWENTLTYRNEWKNKHSLSVMLGQTAQKMFQEVLRLEIKDFVDDRLGYYDLSLGNNKWLTQTPAKGWAMLSYIGRFYYAYDNRYLITLTGRIDGSSKFGANKKYGFFPSAAVAWRLSEEDFMKDIDPVSNLKLRLSYGVVGNEGIAPYQSQGTLVAVSVPFGSGINGGGLAPMTMPNADLAWESTEQYNVGVDIGLFKNRFNIVADYYLKYTSNLLYQVDMPLISGYYFSMRNLGELSNKGFELSISGNPVNNTNLRWTSTFNFDTNVTRIEKLNIAKVESAGTERTRLVVGEKFNNIYGYKTNGIAQLDEDLTQVAQLANRPMVAGEQKYVDVNNDGIINIDDQVALGNLAPKFSYGFNNSFIINKKININLFIEGTYGNKVINDTRRLLELMDGARNNLSTTLDRWTPANPNASLPRADAVFNSGSFSDRWVEDGSYLRIRDFTIGYTVPAKYLKNIASINVYCSAENLWTWTKYSGYDPSIGAGIDNNLYPTSRKYSLGVSIVF